VFGGGGSPEGGWGGVVSRDHRYDSTTEADQGAVQAWLKQRADVVSVRVSGFWDVWHGSDPFNAEIAEPGSAANRSQTVVREGSGASAPTGSGR
jgi:hypothetical protein